MRPVEPSDSTRPSSTDRPLKASLSEPGMNGYATATPSSHAITVTMRRVAPAVSGCRYGSRSRPACTLSKK